MDLKQFVTTWQGSDKVDDVATKMGIKKSQATSLANKLRKEGVNLKKFRVAVSVTKKDVTELNKLIKELGTE